MSGVTIVGCVQATGGSEGWVMRWIVGWGVVDKAGW